MKFCDSLQYEKFHQTTNAVNGYTLHVAPVYDYGSPTNGSWYQIVADFRVVKMVFQPNCGVWRAFEIGEYVFFPSETIYKFVNYTNLSCMGELTQSSNEKENEIKIRYCAHRSHTPSLNFAEVLHRQPVREEWPKLVRCLQHLQRIRRIDETVTMVRESCKRICE